MSEGERGEAATPPSLRTIGDDGVQQPQCIVKFQCGLLREIETFQGESVQMLSSEMLLDYVCEMLQFKVKY